MLPRVQLYPWLVGFTKAIENGRYRLVWHVTRKRSHKLN